MATKKLPAATRLALLKRTPDELEKELRRVSRAREREHEEHQAELALTEERMRLLLEVYWAADWVIEAGMLRSGTQRDRLVAGVAAAKKVLDKRSTPVPTKKGKVTK